MKIVEYTLNSDGTIPSFIIDGGYFSVGNGQPAPQDLTLVGVANDDAPGRMFNSESELAEHLAVIGAEWFTLNPATNEMSPFDPVVAASVTWLKLGQ